MAMFPRKKRGAQHKRQRCAPSSHTTLKPKTLSRL